MLCVYRATVKVKYLSVVNAVVILWPPGSCGNIVISLTTVGFQKKTMIDAFIYVPWANTSTFPLKMEAVIFS